MKWYKCSWENIPKIDSAIKIRTKHSEIPETILGRFTKKYKQIYIFEVVVLENKGPHTITGISWDLLSKDYTKSKWRYASKNELMAFL